MVSMGFGRTLPPIPGEEALYIVNFHSERDLLHPYNWSKIRKANATILAFLSTFTLGVGSATYSTAVNSVCDHFQVGQIVGTMGTSLFLFGCASGPIIWGPLSEIHGRKVPILVSCLGYTCFTFGVASAEDIQTIMLCRFFSGFTGSAPLAVAPAIIADVFKPTERSMFQIVFAFASYGGPMIAPVIGGFTVKNANLGWRWTSYFPALMSCLVLLLLVFLFEETFALKVLARKAEILRRRTGNWGIHSELEQKSFSLEDIVKSTVIRPIKMLFSEITLLLISICNAFVYALIYMFLTAIPLIFKNKYDFSEGVAELPYLSMLSGLLLAAFLIILYNKRMKNKVIKMHIPPKFEDQLILMTLGSLLSTIGLFWLGWGGSFPESVNWIVPTLGAAFMGSGVLLIFVSSLSYLIDCYLPVAASAVAANTFLRCAFGGIFPLFTHQMFITMEIKWASTLLGCIASLMIPISFMFYRHGYRVREKSQYATRNDTTDVKPYQR